jgi:hypothetical protein
VLVITLYMIEFYVVEHVSGIYFKKLFVETGQGAHSGTEKRTYKRHISLIL